MVIEKSATEDESITDLILRYQRTGTGLRRILELIAPLVYRYPKSVRARSEDACGDFFCAFFPKVPGLIRRFRYAGLAFEAYLASCLKWQYKTFVTTQAKRALALHTLHRETLWPQEALVESDVADIVVRETPTPDLHVRSVLSINRHGVIEDPIAARRVILLALKASQELDQEAVCRVAKMTNVSETWLWGKVCELHERLEDRRTRREKVRRRRDRAYFRIQCFESRLEIEVSGRERRRIMALLERERLVLDNALRTLAKVPVCPTHRDIADVLDVPKGSVDSSLYYLKHSLAESSEIDDALGSN